MNIDQAMLEGATSSFWKRPVSMPVTSITTTKLARPGQPVCAFSLRVLLTALALIFQASAHAEPGRGAEVEAAKQTSGVDTTGAASTHALAGGHYRLSIAERALLKHYWIALKSPDLRAASLEQVRRQLERNPAIAFVADYWVTPIDMATLLRSSPIRDTLQSRLPTSPAGEEASALMADMPRLRQLAAVAFTANSAREEAGLPYVGELAQTRETAPKGNGLFVVPLKDVDWVLSEYLPPPPEAGGQDECYFYCGDAETWDFDGDGLPDIRDDDDDNDGTPDANDAYPLWPGASSCECDAENFVVLITKFAVGIRDTVLAAHSVLTGLDESSSAQTLGSIGGGELPVQLVFPAELVPLEERPGADDCPRPGAPGVSYISTDPDDCAVLRFRCEANQVAFTNDCGCGCLDEPPQ